MHINISKQFGYSGGNYCSVMCDATEVLVTLCECVGRNKSVEK